MISPTARHNLIHCNNLLLCRFGMLWGLCPEPARKFIWNTPPPPNLPATFNTEAGATRQPAGFAPYSLLMASIKQYRINPERIQRTKEFLAGLATKLWTDLCPWSKRDSNPPALLFSDEKTSYPFISKIPKSMSKSLTSPKRKPTGSRTHWMMGSVVLLNSMSLTA